MSLINSVPEMVLTTKLDQFLNWTRKSSLWYMLFGLACCAIEMMQTGGPRSDLDRFGMAPRATPRVSGPHDRRGHAHAEDGAAHQGALRADAGPEVRAVDGELRELRRLFQLAYSVCDGVDKVIPVDVYVPGCPPRPEALTEGCCSCKRR
jgi:NADH-quinone oxidoreductase subunit B